MRVTIIGAGNTGSTIAYAIRGLAIEIILVDIDEKKAEAECLDLRDSCEIDETQTEINFSNKVKERTDYYIICVGKPLGINDVRMTYFDQNRKTVENILNDIAIVDNDPFIIMVTNPSHELAKIALNIFRKVFACGRSLDIARTKVCGKHEEPTYSNHYPIISKYKGYTNWAVASEVRNLLATYKIRWSEK